MSIKTGVKTRVKTGVKTAVKTQPLSTQMRCIKRIIPTSQSAKKKVHKMHPTRSKPYHRRLGNITIMLNR